MKLTRCDNHHDRDAVATFRIVELPVGSRPLLVGYNVAGRTVDLCEECAGHVRFCREGFAVERST